MNLYDKISAIMTR